MCVSSVLQWGIATLPNAKLGALSIYLFSVGYVIFRPTFPVFPSLPHLETLGVCWMLDVFRLSSKNATLFKLGCKIEISCTFNLDIMWSHSCWHQNSLTSTALLRTKAMEAKITYFHTKICLHQDSEKTLRFQRIFFFENTDQEMNWSAYLFEQI